MLKETLFWLLHALLNDSFLHFSHKKTYLFPLYLLANQIGVPIMCYDNGLQPVVEAPMWPLNNPVVCFFFAAIFSPDHLRQSETRWVRPNREQQLIQTAPIHIWKRNPLSKGMVLILSHHTKAWIFSHVQTIHVYPKSPGAPLKVKASSLRPSKRREKKYWYWCSQRLELWQALHARSPVAKKRHR